MFERDEGHLYELQDVTDKIESSVQIIGFMKRIDGKIVQDGTTNEEVLRMMIARMEYLQEKISCRENSIVITKLEECLMWLEHRTKLRIEQKVETKDLSHKS